MSALVAALYVDPKGPYFGRDDVDPWDETRDARLYAGPLPVVAHPPCARWGRFWWRGELGADGGCFESALASVERWGGVLEHPEGTLAWARFGLPIPVRGRWTRTLFSRGWSCSVDQGNYGHRARKRTWLYYVGAKEPASLDWTDAKCSGYVMSGPGKSATAESRREHGISLLTRFEKRATPPCLPRCFFNSQGTAETHQPRMVVAANARSRRLGIPKMPDAEARLTPPPIRGRTRGPRCGVELMTHAERRLTPLAFAEALLALARSVHL